MRPAPRADREFDVTLVGATGFVGRLTAAHLAARVPDGVRVALAARSAARLEELPDRVPRDVGPVVAQWPRLVLDVTDGRAATDLARRSRVVATTAGPYVRYGTALVEACAAAGTHYADLTGELLFVRRSIEVNHEPAQRSRARIVHACGFDSVPSDLGAWLTARAAAEDGAGTLTEATLYVRRLTGGVSGGSIDTLRRQVATGPDADERAILADPYALSPARSQEPSGRPTQPKAFPRRMRHLVPVWRDGSTGQIVAPFMMGPFNSRIVRRSNALADWSYGRDLRYRELFDAGTGPAGLRRAVLLTAGPAVLAAGLARRPTRAVLDRLLPAPGEGPSEQTMRRGRFVFEVEALTTSGARYRTRVSADLDPGYTGTAVMFGESALALACDDLPDRAGVLTPAVAFGDALVHRLRNNGFTLETTRL